MLSMMSKLPTSTASLLASWEREEGSRREVYMLMLGSREGEGEKVSKEAERERRLISMAKVRERVSFLRAFPTTAGAGGRREVEEGASPPPPPGKVCQLEVVETASEFATEAASSSSSLMAARRSFGGSSLAPGGRPSCNDPNMSVEADFSAALASGV
jgi:hypothetical protein